jgi:exosortase
MRIAHWQRVLAILALACLVALVYWPSSAVYAAQWSDLVNITYTHGWLILAVCLALVVRERDAIVAAEARPWRAAQLALAACAFVWLVCYRANNQDLHVTVFPALVWLAVAAAFGRQVARVLLFPVLFFYFAVPSWSELAAPLQSLTVLAVDGLLKATGPPAIISGDLIHIPNGTFRIEEGCNGLHFLIVGLAIAALHGELRRDPWRTRTAQLVFMTWLALLANWVRVYSVIERGYLTDMQTYLVRVSHYWFGWGVFAVALVAFFWVTERFGPRPQPRSTEGAAPAVPLARSEVIGVAGAVAILVALPALSAMLRALNPAPLLATSPAPQPTSAWSLAPPDPHSSWTPEFVKPDLEERLAFTDPSGNAVEAYTVAYRTQSQEAKLYGSHSSILGRDLHLRSRAVVNTAGRAFRESVVSDGAGARWLIWSRYEVGQRPFVAPLVSQLWYGLVATVSNPPARLIALRTACAPDCDGARRVLQAFLTGGPALPEGS